MKGQLLAALAVLLAASCAGTAEASGLGSRSELDVWASRAQHRLEQATPASLPGCRVCNRAFQSTINSW